MKSDEKNYIYTEHIDYADTPQTSIWGSGDDVTLKFLEDTEMSGTWLNLAAGDGRYNTRLLKKANNVIAADIDEGALYKLRKNTPREYVDTLQTKIFDITQSFPFKNEYFDGVFCTGTLHLFPKKILDRIVLEMDRVLKHDGILIIDFATDVQRLLPDGNLHARESEPQYTKQEAKDLFVHLLPHYQIEITEAEVPPEKVTMPGLEYEFSCQFILLIAHKK